MSKELLERSDLESETVAAREAKQERDISFPKTDRIYHTSAMRRRYYQLRYRYYLTNNTQTYNLSELTSLSCELIHPIIPMTRAHVSLPRLLCHPGCYRALSSTFSSLLRTMLAPRSATLDDYSFNLHSHNEWSLITLIQTTLCSLAWRKESLSTFCRPRVNQLSPLRLVVNLQIPPTQYHARHEGLQQGWAQTNG
jgi:hypothetical protein